MKKARIKATIMAAVLCIATLGACGSKSIPRQDDYKQPTTEAKTTEKATDKVTEKETEKVTQKVTEKATAKVAKTNYGISDLDLAFLKAENTANNKAYSPLSIKYALNMLSYGASGNTKTQIEKVLGNNAVADYKTSENISIANSLFVRDSYKSGIKESYISSLQKDFKAELVYDSFENATNVNKWVSDKTYGIIDNLLPAIDKNTDFMLINALAIDMEWKYNFRPTSDSKTDAPVFARSARYEHINYGIGIDFNIIAPFKFNNASSEVSAMPIMASIDNYDIIKLHCLNF